MQKIKKVVILGGGESGVGAAILSKKEGYKTFLSDLGEISEKYKRTLDTNAIPYEEGKHTLKKVLEADLVVKSPGIPDQIPLIQNIHQQGILVTSEIESGFQHLKYDAIIIGITGSNGKTTTTLLTYHLLKNSGVKVGVAGNIGESFAKQVIKDEFDYYVLEVSSFQLDGVYDFKADVSKHQL